MTRALLRIPRLTDMYQRMMRKRDADELECLQKIYTQHFQKLGEVVDMKSLSPVERGLVRSSMQSQQESNPAVATLEDELKKQKIHKRFVHQSVYTEEQNLPELFEFSNKRLRRIQELRNQPFKEKKSVATQRRYQTLNHSVNLDHVKMPTTRRNLDQVIKDEIDKRKSIDINLQIPLEVTKMIGTKKPAYDIFKKRAFHGSTHEGNLVANSLHGPFNENITFEKAHQVNRSHFNHTPSLFNKTVDHFTNYTTSKEDDIFNSKQRVSVNLDPKHKVNLNNIYIDTTRSKFSELHPHNNFSVLEKTSGSILVVDKEKEVQEQLILPKMKGAPSPSMSKDPSQGKHDTQQAEELRRSHHSNLRTLVKYNQRTPN